MGKSNQTLYPPSGTWRCPVCSHDHSKPHYAFEGQIDFKKKPLAEGRVKFDREDYCGTEKGDTEHKRGVNSTGPAFGDQDLPNPLFCPHCGWQDKLIFIIKKYTDCCIRGCPNAATNNKEGKYPTCQEHAGIITGQ